jgi:hypothetical protein
MRETADMLLSLRDRAVPVERYRGLPEAERGDRFATGVLVDRGAPGFNERYAAIQARAAQDVVVQAA